MASLHKSDTAPTDAGVGRIPYLPSVSSFSEKVARFDKAPWEKDVERRIEVGLLSCSACLCSLRTA